MSQSGTPQIVYTGKVSNFVGSSVLLMQMDREKVINDHVVERITWKFIPPAYPL